MNEELFFQHQARIHLISVLQTNTVLDFKFLYMYWYK